MSDSIRIHIPVYTTKLCTSHCARLPEGVSIA